MAHWPGKDSKGGNNWNFSKEECGGPERKIKAEVGNPKYRDPSWEWKERFIGDSHPQKPW